MTYVIKRDGSKVKWDSNKIVNAVRKAFESCKEEDKFNENEFKEFANSFTADTIDIESIQDAVEYYLMGNYPNIAKAYIICRKERAKIRDFKYNKTYYNTVLGLLNGETNDVSKENANKDPKQFFTMRDLVAGETCKKIYKDFIMDSKLLELHNKGIIHVHDTDYRAMKGMTNCFSQDTKFITSKGVISFNDVHDGTIVYVPTHTGKWKKAIVHNYGIQDLYEYTISTVNRIGYGVKVKATENHRWFLNSGVQTTDLKIGDKLLTKNDLISNISLDYILNNSELVKYWCYGFILGDGSTVDNSYMYSHNLGKRKKSSTSKCLFKTVVRLCKDKIKYLQYFLNANMVSYPIKNSKDLLVVDYTFNKKEFLKNKDYTKLTKEQLVALIKGLICADGEHKKYNPIIGEEVADGISASNKNIQEIIEKYSALAGYYISKVSINNKVTNYGIRQSSLYEYKFITQIPKRRISKKGFESYTTIPYKVLNKEYIGKENVWCLEVEDDHSFILANGLITGNCCLINLKDMLINGTCVQGKRIHNIHSLIVASNVTTQIIAAVGSSQYGGITIDISHLSPFIERSKIKYRDIFKELDGPIQEKYVNAFIKKEIVDSIQLIQYQLNTLTTTNGQSPFITIACNTNGQDDEYPEYTAMLIEELLKQRIKGMEGPNGNNINPSFPKIVYILTENNIKEGTKYYYLTKLAAECTAKRMVPDYMSEKICKQYKEGRVIPPMGCRSILTPWKNKEGKYQEFGRFNIGVFSINLPYLALNSTTIEEFKEKLVDMIDFLSEQQYKVYKTICNQPVDIASILWMDGAFFRAKSGQKIGEILPKGYCTASIGYIGLAECAYRFNIDYPTEEGQKFGLDIMKVFYDRVQFNAKKYNLSLSIYGTPAENTTTTFAKALKIFPTIKNVNDKNYVTNSYHVPVWYNIDGYNKIKFEAPFQKYSSGGCISYVEMPDINHNTESVLNIMQYIYDHMMYCELNTTSCDVCYKCGFHGQIELLGDNNFRCPNCGNTNSLSLYIQRRLCGYLGTLTNGISIGREGDIMDRAKHF